MVILHWNLYLLISLGLLAIIIFLLLAHLLRQYTKHDLYRSKNGNIYVIVDL